MDNTLLAGFITACASVCAAVLGALATVAAAFISKGVVASRFRTTADITRPDPSTVKLLKLFDFFRLSEAALIDLPSDTAHIDQETNFILSVGRVSSGSVYNLKFQPPAGKLVKKEEYVVPGWNVSFPFQGTTYALTFIQTVSRDFDDLARFDFRKIGLAGKPAAQDAEEA